MDPGDVAERTRLLALRGQGTTTGATSQVDTGLVDRAISADEQAREPARRMIIDTCDVRTMIACAERARSSGDESDVEFWWLELATAPAPAGDDEITAGVVGLCTQVLMPQHRLAEAELYCRHLLARESPSARQAGRSMLDQVESVQRTHGVTRPVDSGGWLRVDLSQPIPATADQQIHFDRLYAFFEESDDDGHIKRLLSAGREDFLPYITGWLIGFTQSSEVGRSGITRETAARTLCTWLCDRESRQLARDDRPRGGGLSEASPGL